jgi:hypothetical protein
VLCGIGGKTVTEAKANLSYREAHDWFAFARQRGGLIHTDRLLATIATQINRLAGGEAEIGDFLPYLKTANKNEKEADIGEVMNLLSMVAM